MSISNIYLPKLTLSELQQIANAVVTAAFLEEVFRFETWIIAGRDPAVNETENILFVSFPSILFCAVNKRFKSPKRKSWKRVCIGCVTEVTVAKQAFPMNGRDEICWFLTTKYQNILLPVNGRRRKFLWHQGLDLSHQFTLPTSSWVLPFLWSHVLSSQEAVFLSRNEVVCILSSRAWQWHNIMLMLICVMIQKLFWWMLSKGEKGKTCLNFAKYWEF